MNTNVLTDSGEQSQNNPYKLGYKRNCANVFPLLGLSRHLQKRINSNFQSLFFKLVNKLTCSWTMDMLSTSCSNRAFKVFVRRDPFHNFASNKYVLRRVPFHSSCFSRRIRLFFLWCQVSSGLFVTTNIENHVK